MRRTDSNSSSSITRRPVSTSISPNSYGSCHSSSASAAAASMSGHGGGGSSRSIQQAATKKHEGMFRVEMNDDDHDTPSENTTNETFSIVHQHSKALFAEYSGEAPNDPPQQISSSLDRTDVSLPHRSLDEFLEVASSEATLRYYANVVPITSSSNYTHVALVSNPSGSFNDGAMMRRPPSYPWRYWWIYLSLGVANSSDAAEILCLSYILSVDSFQESILQHTAWKASLLAATVFGGMLMGGLFVGCLGDWWGRWPMLVTGLAVNAVAGLLSAVSLDVYTLSLCRFAAGLGIGATVPPLFALGSELAPPSARGFYVTVIASFWMVGSMYVAVVGWILLGGTEHNSNTNTSSETSNRWRIFAAACAVPSCIGCVLVRAYVPESPRFLLLQGRHDAALAVVHRLAESIAYTGPPMTREELLYQYPPTIPHTTNVSSEGVDDDAMGDGFLPSGHDNGMCNETALYSCSRLDSRPSSSLAYYNVLCTAIRDFTISTSHLYTPHMRSTTWPLQMVWFSLSFGSYGLMTWINTLFKEVHLENVYFNALLFSASNLPGNLLSAYFMDKTGRASLLTGSVLAAALSLVAFAYVAAVRDNHQDESGGVVTTTHTVSATWIVVAACSFQCFTIAAWNAIDVLTSELFPTAVRSTGMGVCSASGRIGALLAQLVNGVLVSHPVRLLLTAATALLLGSLTPAFLPADQTGRPVQDYTTTDDRSSSHDTATAAARPSRTTSPTILLSHLGDPEAAVASSAVVVEEIQRRSGSNKSSSKVHRGRYERVHQH